MMRASHEKPRSSSNGGEFDNADAPPPGMREVPGKLDTYCDQVTDNFRIISPHDFRILARAEYILD
jgi:hypothetical protein